MARTCSVPTAYLRCNMKKFRITIHLPEVEAEDDDSDTVKEAVKNALNRKMLQDDAGEEELEFEAEEIEDDF